MFDDQKTHFITPSGGNKYASIWSEWIVVIKENPRIVKGNVNKNGEIEVEILWIFVASGSIRDFTFIGTFTSIERFVFLFRAFTTIMS